MTEINYEKISQELQNSIDYKSMAEELQLKWEEEHSLVGEYQHQVYELKDDIVKLQAVVEYLENKLGINDSI